MTTFTYDPIDQLLSESRPGYLCEYDYDANGNRLYRRYNGDVVNQENYLYDGADKLTEIRVEREHGEVVRI